MPLNPLTPTTERIADGVWRHAGDLRRAMNIYFIEDDGGVLQFDAGTEAMTESAAEAAKRLGGLTRVVLGHSHADHRGTAPSMGVPDMRHRKFAPRESLVPFFTASACLGLPTFTVKR